MRIPEALSRTLNQFNASALADGNVTSGTNILAGMCCTLANLHPRGAGFVSKSGELLPVGINTLMLDGLSSSLTDVKVFEPMASFQANLTANVRDGNAYEAFHGVGKTIHGTVIQAPPSADIPMVELKNMLHGFGKGADDSSPFESLFSARPKTEHGDFKKRPLVFTRMDACSPPLDKLPPSHLSQPYVRAFLDVSPSHTRFLAHLRSLMQSGGEDAALLPRLALSAPAAAFKQLFSEGQSDFLRRFLWFFDLPLTTDRTAAPSAPSDFPIKQSFDAALRRAWARRLDFRQPSPRAISFEWRSWQENWVNWLGGKEDRFPGISATGHPLFGTLLFGLCSMSTGSRSGPDTAGTLLMAKWLVERMISIREHLIQQEERLRLLRIAEKIVSKLAHDAHTPRELCRRFNELPINDCRKSLEILLIAEVAVRADEEKWKLRVSPADGVRKIQSLAIDV